jgi:hypothetical protein
MGYRVKQLKPAEITDEASIEGSLMLPNFIVIGAMKAGTSSLHAYLQGHPQIFMATPKEPAFFGSNRHRGLSWYEQLFDDAGEAIAIGEASTQYSVYPFVPGVPSRIAEQLPNVRFIYLVRHPIERMLSEYHYNVVRGLERNGFAEHSLLTNLTYEYPSRYALQVEQYLECFAADQILVLQSDDLRNDRARTLGRIHSYLGVDGSWEAPNIQEEYNRSSGPRPRPVDRAVRKIPGYRAAAAAAPGPLREFKRRVTTRRAPPKPVLSKPARRELEDRLRDDVRQLRRYMDGHFDGWGIG